MRIRKDRQADRFAEDSKYIHLRVRKVGLPPVLADKSFCQTMRRQAHLPNPETMLLESFLFPIRVYLRKSAASFGAPPASSLDSGSNFPAGLALVDASGG